jgi:chemotaxis protein CheC
MNALTRLINTELVPSAPYFIQDYGASVLQQALMAQAMISDQALICRTGFHREGEELNWRVLFIPTGPMRSAMEKALRGASLSTLKQHSHLTGAPKDASGAEEGRDAAP